MTRKTLGRFTYAALVLSLVILSACGKGDATMGAPAQAEPAAVQACTETYQRIGIDGENFCVCSLSWEASRRRGLATRQEEQQKLMDCAMEYLGNQGRR